MSPNPQPKREKQMEGKIRERERRAFTARMIDGLRQHGNYNLPAGASMNQVLVAVVSEAGYTVDSDGTTYRPPPPSNVNSKPSNEHERNSNPNPQPAGTIMGDNAAASTSGNKSRKEREKQMEHMFRERDRRAFTTRIIDGLRQHGNYNLPAGASMNQVLVAVVNEAGYIVGPDGTTYRPPPPSNVVANPARVVGNSLKNCSTTASVLRIVENLSPASFDSLVVSDTSTNSSPMNSSGCLEADQSGIINNSCQLVDLDGVKQELQLLKSLNIDGVVVNCWWGIVERWKNQKYEWSGYRELFNIIRNMELKLQVVMAFNAYAGNDFNVDIPLSEWVLKIGKDNPEIFFTDRVGRWNTECLSWGIDTERILEHRTGQEYPSFSERNGWRFPGIGEFQCYDKFLLQSLKDAAKKQGQPSWGRGPDHVGCYNSRPHDTKFFRERGDYDNHYGQFFLRWYSRALIDHADIILSAATEAFDETPLVVKIPGIYWWYKTSSHAAELTAGYYNTSNRDGYSPLFEVLKKLNATMKFVSEEMETQISPHYLVEASADPNGLCWQVLNGARDEGLAIAGHNAPRDYDRETFMRLVETSKPINDPEPYHCSFFVLERPWQRIQTPDSISELEYFVKCMHGYA